MIPRKTFRELTAEAKKIKAKPLYLPSDYKRAGNKMPYLCLKCKKKWLTAPMSIHTGSGCPRCAKKTRAISKMSNAHTILEINLAAKSKGGKCLEKRYMGLAKKHKFKCKKGHVWLASPYYILNNISWCPYCAGQIISISDLKSLALERGGKCIAKKFINVRQKLIWQCGEGHKWKSAVTNVRSGHWCPICKNNAAGGYRRLRLEDFREIALKRNGKLLSIAYKNVDTKLKFECAKGHQWSAIPRNIKKGRWCPICGIEKAAAKKRTPIEEVQKLVQTRGGKLLRYSFRNSNHKLHICCSLGHEFNTTLSAVRNRNWCPTCARGTGERIVRHFFEQIFNAPFLPHRPPWLLNAQGNRMEFDGYNSKLKLAFEHHGEYHYSLRGHYADSVLKLKKRRKDDAKKRWLAKKHGIYLVTIPEVLYRTKLDNLQMLIVSKCKKMGIKIPKNAMNKMIKYEEVFKPRYFEKIQQIVEARGGRVLSKNYLNAKTKMKFICEFGHIWETIPDNIRRGSWCYACAGRSYNMEKMKSFAKAKGGRFLSKSFSRTTEKMRWECSEGHRWNTMGTNIINGHWCPICAKTQIWITRKANSRIKKKRKI